LGEIRRVPERPPLGKRKKRKREKQLAVVSVDEHTSCSQGKKKLGGEAGGRLIKEMFKRGRTGISHR